MNKIYELIVEQGQDIKQSLIDFVLNNEWTDVCVLSAIGSVIDVIFTCPIKNELPLVTANTPCNCAAELTSLVGEIMIRDKMDPTLATIYTDTSCPLFVHLHASCAIAGGHVMGGGLAAGKAFRAVRIFMIPLA